MHNPRCRIIVVLSCFALCTGIVFGTKWHQLRRNAARQMQCASHLTSIAFPLRHYFQRHGRFPQNVCSTEGQPILSWRVELLSIIDVELYKRFQLDEPWDSSTNVQLLKEMPDWYSCPARQRKQGEFFASYFAIAPLSPTSVFDLSVSDDRKCVHLIENSSLEIPWTKPLDIVGDPCASRAALTEGCVCDISGFPHSITVDLTRQLVTNPRPVK